MIRNKHITILFQMVMLLFVAKISYSSYCFLNEKEIIMKSFSLQDDDSTQNNEEEQKDKDEDSLDDVLFFNTMISDRYSSNVVLRKNEFNIRLSSPLKSIFIPPPERS